MRKTVLQLYFRKVPRHLRRRLKFVHAIVHNGCARQRVLKREILFIFNRRQNLFFFRNARV